MFQKLAATAAPPFQVPSIRNMLLWLNVWYFAILVQKWENGMDFENLAKNGFDKAKCHPFSFQMQY